MSTNTFDGKRAADHPREGGQMIAADLAKFEGKRRYATLVALAVEGAVKTSFAERELTNSMGASFLVADRWEFWAPAYLCGRYIQQFPSPENFLCVFADDPRRRAGPADHRIWGMVRDTGVDVAAINKLVAALSDKKLVCPTSASETGRA